jgi:hypothetical protein
MSEKDTLHKRARTVVDRLREEPDETIDYSDIPQLGEDFFRRKGKGFQSRITTFCAPYDRHALTSEAI